MKTLATLLLLFPTSVAFAEACPATEYAELKDMTQEELLAKYCELRKYESSKKQEADSLASRGEMISLQYLGYSFKCASEAERVAGVLKRSFDAEPPQCSAATDDAGDKPADS